jgi:hypothetical protein
VGGKAAHGKISINNIAAAFDSLSAQVEQKPLHQFDIEESLDKNNISY